MKYMLLIYGDEQQLPEPGSPVSQTTRPAWPIKQARSAAVMAAGHNVVSCVWRDGSEVCGCILTKVPVVHLGGYGVRDADVFTLTLHKMEHVPSPCPHCH